MSRISVARKSRLAESPWCPSAILPPLLSFQAPNAGHELLPEAEAQRTLETSSSMPLLDALDLACSGPAWMEGTVYQRSSAGVVANPLAFRSLCLHGAHQGYAFRCSTGLFAMHITFVLQ